MDQVELEKIIQSVLSRFSPKSKQLLIAGNWKMNLTTSQGRNFLDALISKRLDSPHQLVIFPPATTAAQLKNEFKLANIMTGLQNIHWEKSGAFTGELSTEMALDTGCQYVLIGHSERRQFFGETNESVSSKINIAQQFGLIPIVCIGENLEAREHGKTTSILSRQLASGLKGADPMKLVIAYEPVWAIGTGLSASQEQIADTLFDIRCSLLDLFGIRADKIPLLYGGSVKPENAEMMKSIAELGGLLIGQASLSADSFAEIVRILS